jgi:hypothetical protein
MGRGTAGDAAAAAGLAAWVGVAAEADAGFAAVGLAVVAGVAGFWAKTTPAFCDTRRLTAVMRATRD